MCVCVRVCAFIRHWFVIVYAGTLCVCVYVYVCLYFYPSFDCTSTCRYTVCVFCSLFRVCWVSVGGLWQLFVHDMVVRVFVCVPWVAGRMDHVAIVATYSPLSQRGVAQVFQDCLAVWGGGFLHFDRPHSVLQFGLDIRVDQGVYDHFASGTRERCRAHDGMRRRQATNLMYGLLFCVWVCAHRPCCWAIFSKIFLHCRGPL